MKFQFLSASDTPLSSVENSLLENVRRELLQLPGCVEVFNPDDADAIVFQEAFSFKEWRYIDRLRADPIAGRYPHKLMTINVDDGATGLLRGIYTSLPANRYDLLLHRSIPYDGSPNRAVYARRDQPNPAPQFLASWRGNPTSKRPAPKNDAALLREPALQHGNHRRLVQS